MEDRSQVWMRLSPDAMGDYSNGSWRFTAPMSIPRLFFASNIVRDTRLIVIGGEYSGIGLQPNWTRTGEAYNPATDTWHAHCAASGIAVWRRSHYSAGRRSHSRRFSIYP